VSKLVLCEKSLRLTEAERAEIPTELDHADDRPAGLWTCHVILIRVMCREITASAVSLCFIDPSWL